MSKSDEGGMTFEEAIMEGYPVEHPDYEGAWVYVPEWGYFHHADKYHVFKHEVGISKFRRIPPNKEDHSFWTSPRWSSLKLSEYLGHLESIVKKVNVEEYEENYFTADEKSFIIQFDDFPGATSIFDPSRNS